MTTALALEQFVRWLSTLLGDLHQPLHWLLGLIWLNRSGGVAEWLHTFLALANFKWIFIWMKVVTFSGECHPQNGMVYLTGLFSITSAQVDWQATPIGYPLYPWGWRRRSLGRRFSVERAGESNIASWKLHIILLADICSWKRCRKRNGNKKTLQLVTETMIKAYQTNRIQLWLLHIVLWKTSFL